MLKTFLGLVVSIMFFLPAHSSSKFVKSVKYPTEIVHSKKSRLSSIEKRSQEATVKVIHEDSHGYGTGTYFTFNKFHIVITAAHVVVDKKRLLIQTPKGTGQLGHVIYKSPEHIDIAILVTHKIPDRTPIPLNNMRSPTNLLGAPIVYSGFPNNHDLMLIRGSIAGYERDDDTLLAQSYAWMGASGSGVFDRRTGQFVGVLSAIDVGMAYYPQLVESIVWVSPSWHINRKELSTILQNFQIITDGENTAENKE